ncbi:ankyrin repeat and BTB/POZ domain-containing protein 1-like isoform X2 [Stegodyphus dumicola]|uniref:ankyrin repeat and BTB/POZ domain-containing protein 1-like isoform X2 n=1 Tax=Stegodyphus dumicola TaxID=202533 RepID=UPI0015A8F741|nr:ankyrin repeat and BTB/POZ domain-containing protein 1-like isoform X2 [Stegodyphus dumicola]
MDKYELFLSCRKGDVRRLRYLVEQKDVDLNVRDKWDCTPLYYACLCGHYDTVLYLLENGACCDSETFDGERCLYGALTEEIYHLLRNFQVVTSKLIKRDEFSEFLRRALETDDYCDMHFVVQKVQLFAHRCILAARSEFFKNAFDEEWRNLTSIRFTEYFTAAALKGVLHYMYTGEVELNIRDKDDFIFLANHIGCSYLGNEIEKLLKKRKNLQAISVEPKQYSSLSQDFHTLFLSTLPEKFLVVDHVCKSQYVDVHVSVKGYIFTCHKIFICGRCDYFKALISDHFSETYKDNVKRVQVVELHDISPEVFVSVLQYIYTYTADLSPSNIFEVLHASDMFLLPGLKRLCAVTVKENLTVDNVVEVTKLARLYNLPRLETHCTEYMAIHLEKCENKLLLLVQLLQSYTRTKFYTPCS